MAIKKISSSESCVTDTNNGGRPNTQPYILSVKNTTSEIVKNFTILYPYGCINNPFFHKGIYEKDGVIVNSIYQSITYQDILLQMMAEPESISRTYIEMVSGKNRQLKLPIILDCRKGNGNQYMQTIVPEIKKGQVQKSIIEIDSLYTIDGGTRLTFTKILPNSHFRIHFYPPVNK